MSKEQTQQQQLNLAPSSARIPLLPSLTSAQVHDAIHQQLALNIIARALRQWMHQRKPFSRIKKRPHKKARVACSICIRTPALTHCLTQSTAASERAAAAQVLLRVAAADTKSLVTRYIGELFLTNTMPRVAMELASLLRHLQWEPTLAHVCTMANMFVSNKSQMLRLTLAHACESMGQSLVWSLHSGTNHPTASGTHPTTTTLSPLACLVAVQAQTESDTELAACLQRMLQCTDNEKVQDNTAQDNDNDDLVLVANLHNSHHDEDDDEEDDDDEIESMMEDDEEDDENANNDGDEMCVGDDEDTIEEQRAMQLEMEQLESPLPVSALAAHQQQSLQPLASSNRKPTTTTTTTTTTAPTLVPCLADRKRRLVRASMQVLHAQYPHHVSTTSISATTASGQQQQHSSGQQQHIATVPTLLTMTAEHSLLQSINNLVQPFVKPLALQVILRRAPTQEEFFRGSLKTNPVALSNLGKNAEDPTVHDLQQHIARELKMADSAELLELVVANRILHASLKLRVVHQVLWRQHVRDNHGSAFLSSSSQSSAAGYTMVFSSGLTELLHNRATVAAASNLASSEVLVHRSNDNLPAMIVTYRLAGVDGEATEDTVSHLVDPEAPDSAATRDERDALVEKEYGMTRLVMADRGASVLLRSIQRSHADSLRRIRRDHVGSTKNLSREAFTTSAPSAGLILLRHSAQLPSNRALLLRARAPTLLLVLLLDVLNVLEEQSMSSNPTADMLQALIESLTLDISFSHQDEGQGDGGETEYETDAAHDASSMPLLLESIETISLSPPLRQIIAKLLPFLTYGQTDLCRTLAEHFARNIKVDALSENEQDNDSSKSSVLMNTFVQTAISLPSNDICNSLRDELIHVGFVERLTQFVAKDMPKQPPTWTPALLPKGEVVVTRNRRKVKGKKLPEEAWREYFARPGIRTALEILTGLCKQHAPTQTRIAAYKDFVQSCHWIEATSDHPVLDIAVDGLGLLAETLLDEIMESNDLVRATVEAERKKTLVRKKELAEERRHQALSKMNSFGHFRTTSPTASAMEGASATLRGAAASVLGPMFGLFREQNTTEQDEASSRSSSRTARAVKGKQKAQSEKPAWLAEMEAMQDDVGLTCAVCQEGRTLQPRELLGLYAFVKKVSVSAEQGGSRLGIDGTSLLQALPANIPDYLIGDPFAEEWYLIGKAASEHLPTAPSQSSATVVNNRRSSIYTTTVSAGNAIHFSCHRAARLADRNHPKAPKSEWEGAALRNNRAQCNVVLPLVSSRSSEVPLISVNSALTEYQAAVTNIIGITQKSMLWTVLHDIRFLLLRMAHGESLNADCAGGSVASNCKLIFYQFLIADMFEKDGQVDQPRQVQHAKGLSAGFLAACAVVLSKKSGSSSSSLASLTRGVADAAPTAALASIMFHNVDDSCASSTTSTQPHPKRLWVHGKELFLKGLLICAGRRHALRITSSGCESARSSVRNARAMSFSEWDDTQDIESGSPPPAREPSNRRAAGSRPSSSRNRAPKPCIGDFQNALRPMLTLYAILDSLSAEFTFHMDDDQVEESSGRLVQVIEDCQRAPNIQELLEKTNITLKHDEMIEILQKGMVVA
jgi:hypothetical protein